MTRRLAPAVLLAAAALAAPVLQGCAADDVASVDVAQAAQNTAAKKTARIAGIVQVEGFGLPGALELPLSGVASLTKPELDLSADVGAVLQKLKAAVGALPLELRVRGGIAYVKVPEMVRSIVPGGKPWAALNLRKFVKNLGQDPAAVNALMSVDAASLLRALRAAGKLTTVGTEEIDGAKTTHLRGTVRLEDQLKLLPAKSRAAARAAIRKLAGKQASAGQPVDVWIDEDDVVRRESAVVSLPGQHGLPAGKVTLRIDYRDFGTPLASDIPAAKDTFDATQVLSRVGFAHAKALKTP
jgi:hypothetical protein